MRWAGVAGRGGRSLGYLAMAAVTYIPILVARPGRVVADTKQYLYLDPGRLLERAWSMWDPNIGMGTVTHQNIGYLFPMGPWYWTLDGLGVPDWVAQRIWLASIVFGAGLGMLYLFRTLALRGPGAVVGALVFMFSPYWLEYAGRLSVLLLPWAGLPWMLALFIRGLRRGGWRHAALLALVVQVIGSVNITALVFAGLALLVWIPYALFVEREVRWRRVFGTVLKIGGLTVAASAWWLSGLWAQGTYGLNVLKFTETMRVVSTTTLPSEVLRGLGYWFFYGRDRLGPWIEASTDYTQRPALILISYAIPTLALLAAAFVRWRHRVFFLVVIVVGVVVAVGSHPYDSPTPLGAVFKNLSQESTVAFALRSTGRAVPLVVLGLAGLIAAGVTAVWVRIRASRRPRMAVAVPALAGALVFLNLPALWTGAFYGDNLQRPERIPEYWRDAARALDRGGSATRVLEVPGSDFGSYRWGQTVDPITPGITDRPFVAREVIPYGSPASANLLNAFDLRLQDRKLTPNAIAPLARMMGIGAITVRNDVQFERYRLLRPLFAWDLFTPTPSGLGDPLTFGKPTSAQSTQYPFLDEQALLADPTLPLPPPVGVFPVRRPTPILRAGPRLGPLLVAGDGEGLVDAAEAGLLAGNPLIQYSGSFGNDPAGLRTEVRKDATLVVTDSNRDRGRRWSSLTETAGFTEGPGSHPLTADESDSRLDLFPDAPSDAETVTVLEGAKSVRSDRYGNTISYTPEDRPARAFDGDVRTAWRTGQFDDVQGDRIRIALDQPIITDRVNLVQVLTVPNERFITRAVLRFDGGSAMTVEVGPDSRTAEGQTVSFPRRRFRSFEVEVDATNVGEQIIFSGMSPVGFAEIRLRGEDAAAPPVLIREVVRMPGDLLRVAGAESRSRRVILLMNRDRVLPVPARTDPEIALAREFTLPTERSFAIAGDARLSRARTDPEIDATLGYQGPIVASSSGRLVGAPAVRASSALDHDVTTAWVTPFREGVDSWINVNFGGRRTVDHLDLALVADGRHSVPTEIVITNPAGDRRPVPLVVPVDQGAANGTISVSAAFPAITGEEIRVRVTTVRPVLTTDYDCECDVEMPVAIAELGIPNLAAVKPPAVLRSECRTDLVNVDGQPVRARLAGSTFDAAALRPIRIVRCEDPGSLVEVRLLAGPHVMRTGAGDQSGIDIDRLVWASEPDGVASRDLRVDATLAPAPRVPVPSVQVIRNDRAEMTARVTGADGPFWLVLGQSQNAGWEATVNGRSIGTSRLVDGYANGWLIRSSSSNLTIDLEWRPQRTVERSMALSMVAIMVCLGIVVVSTGRRRADDPAVAVPDQSGPEFLLPWQQKGSRTGVLATVVAATVVGAFAVMVVNPVIGVAAGVAVAGALIWPRLRVAVFVVPPAAIAAAGAYMARRQAQHHLPAIFEWPTFFVRARTLGWLVVVALAANIAIALLIDRQQAHSEDEGSPMDPYGEGAESSHDH